ncbi:hypothetical protein NA56DRAFT_749908 [Hyaloscypha hepaticicola]|uniref:Uncharacterized protein n=1 Tax=Hyaloscypha hepaticicola TaxID=2082293 RepID=A0A2J6Q2L5_9HELO|nr:hypothetical protein NA56DRAFT_749908 [Hyaloscypha hepaticicola]
MKDDRYEEAPLLVETSHLMKRIGVLSQIIIIIVIQGFGILAYLSILDPVAVGVGKENLVQLPDYVLLLQGSPATLTITWVISPICEAASHCHSSQIGTVRPTSSSVIFSTCGPQSPSAALTMSSNH